MWVHRSRVETWKRRNSVSFLSTRTKRFRLSFRSIPVRKKSETILVSRRVSCQDNRIPRVTTRVLPPFDPFPRSVAWNFARQSSTSGIRKRNFHLRSGMFHSRQIFTDFSSWSFHDRWSRSSVRTMGGQQLFFLSFWFCGDSDFWKTISSFSLQMYVTFNF